MEDKIARRLLQLTNHCISTVYKLQYEGDIMLQSQFQTQNDCHDSIQYHFFAENLFIAIRIFKTATVTRCSVWGYDGNVFELVKSDGSIAQSEAKYLDVSGESLSINVPNESGVLTVRSETGLKTLVVSFKAAKTISWMDRAGSDHFEDTSVMHQPELLCTITRDDKTYEGVGYCKRYTWLNPPSHCEWNFFHGVSSDKNLVAWTADATFGKDKYNYYKIWKEGQPVKESTADDTYHLLDSAIGIIDETKCRFIFNEIASWETHIKSEGMDGLLRQRYGTMTIEGFESSIITGVALHENYIGSMG